MRWYRALVITGPDGPFEFAGLLPGEYKMTVELQGFTREEINFAIAVNQRVRLDVVLKAGGVAQQVDSTAVPLLHVSDATVGSNVFNTVNYGTPNRFVNTPQFGTITGAATPARQIQSVFRATF